MININKIGSHAQIRTGDPYHVKVATQQAQPFDFIQYSIKSLVGHKRLLTPYESITYKKCLANFQRILVIILKLCKWLIICAGILASGQANSEDHLGIIIRSTHLNDKIENPNESNLGVYVQHEKWQLGIYTNSYDDTSVFIAVETGITDYVSFSLGAVSGYEKNPNNKEGFLPLAFINIYIKQFTISVNTDVLVFGLRF